MPENRTPLRASADNRRLRRWRFEQFSGLGFGLGATTLLVYSAIDPEEARRLIALGCPPRTAADILL